MRLRGFVLHGAKERSYTLHRLRRAKLTMMRRAAVPRQKLVDFKLGTIPVVRQRERVLEKSVRFYVRKRIYRERFPSNKRRFRLRYPQTAG